MKSRLLGAVCAYAFSLVSIPSHAALVDNGGGLIYDDVLDITWAQPDTLRVRWDEANTRAAQLTLGGATEWRLPYISVEAGAGPFTGDPVPCSDAIEVACRDNELGYMFYQNLSGTLNESILDSGDPDLALFPTLESFFYWSGTETVLGAWQFNFNDGRQENSNTDFDNAFWAVHDGNVVPEPGTALLMGLGLAGLGVSGRRRREESQGAA